MIGKFPKVGPRVYGGFDADAQAFITAAAITDATQQQAINTLVVDLKAQSLWTKMKAVYPFVGGTASSHKFNLKDPRDLDAAFRLIFNGTWIHSSTGSKPNAVNAFAQTRYTPSSNAVQNSHHLSYYSRTNSNATEVEIGGVDASNGSLIEIRTSGVTYFRNNSGATYATYTDANSLGFYTVSRVSSTQVKGFKNGALVATGNINSTSLGTREYYLGAFNDNGITQFYSSKECAFASIGSGLSDSEVATLNTLVTNLQTTLGRNV